MAKLARGTTTSPGTPDLGTTTHQEATQTDTENGQSGEITGFYPPASVITTPSSTSPNGEGILVDIDLNAPWAGWPMPEVVPTKMEYLRVNVDKIYMPSGGERLIIEDNAGMVGYPTSSAIHDLSIRVGFPWDFISKLPLRLQSEVINSRIAEARKTGVTMTRQPMLTTGSDGLLVPREEGYRTVTNVSPGWRGILRHGEVAQKAYNMTRDVYGADGVTIKTARLTDSGMEVRLQTNRTEEVSRGGRGLGDVISLGLLIMHRYGVELAVKLYVERLICLNGMTSSTWAFEWKSVATGSPRDQLDGMCIGVANALVAFDGVVDKARTMANTPLEGDAERMLLERARAMRLPQTHHEDLLSAWRQEPVTTEWGMLNAFTRFATHSPGLNDRQRLSFQQTAGDWTTNFDMVSARLPRPIAEAVGASIYEVDELA